MQHCSEVRDKFMGACQTCFKITLSAFQQCKGGIQNSQLYFLPQKCQPNEKEIIKNTRDINNLNVQQFSCAVVLCLICGTFT